MRVPPPRARRRAVRVRCRRSAIPCAPSFMARIYLCAHLASPRPFHTIMPKYTKHASASWKPPATYHPPPPPLSLVLLSATGTLHSRTFASWHYASRDVAPSPCRGPGSSAAPTSIAIAIVSAAHVNFARPLSPPNALRQSAGSTSTHNNN